MGEMKGRRKEERKGGRKGEREWMSSVMRYL